MRIQPRNTIVVGDAPPFFQLRDYGVEGQIGLESSVDEWVERLRAVFAELARVLKPGGAVWVDLADSYSHAVRHGPLKSLLLAPERLLLALIADGWIVRNQIIWQKRAPMPSGVGDR